jgi:hypothetical protein
VVTNSVPAPVPEPATLLMVATGAMAIGRRALQGRRTRRDPVEGPSGGAE